MLSFYSRLPLAGTAFSLPPAKNRSRAGTAFSLPLAERIEIMQELLLAYLLQKE
jgi:hypothetical protein